MPGAGYPGGVKEFVVYTALRLVLFAASLAVVMGVWLSVAGQANLLWSFVLAFVISGIGSYFLLNGPREAFARRVDERARRAASRFEEIKAREDAEDAEDEQRRSDAGEAPRA
ncbi:hypothetical protein GCM10009719_20270 [Nocardioides kribbensis]